MSTHFLDNIPILLVYVGLLLLFLGAVETGYKLGDIRQRRTDYVDESRTQQAGIVLGAMLTLTGFLLAFTFSMAGSQFDSRRQLVMDDVNAIGTTYLRAEHLPAMQSESSRALLQEYVSGRDTLFDQSLTKRLDQVEQLHQELWSIASEVAALTPSPIVSLYIQSLNQMIDLHGKRVSIEMWVRIPDMIFMTLAVLSLLTMTLTGYLLGMRQNRYGYPTVLMIITYATVFLLVIDLDRPVRGLFYVDQAPMTELAEKIISEQLLNTENLP